MPYPLFRPLVHFKRKPDVFEDELNEKAAGLIDADAEWMVIEADHADALMNPSQVR